MRRAVARSSASVCAAYSWRRGAKRGDCQSSEQGEREAGGEERVDEAGGGGQEGPTGTGGRTDNLGGAEAEARNVGKGANGLGGSELIVEGGNEVEKAAPGGLAFGHL